MQFLSIHLLPRRASGIVFATVFGTAAWAGPVDVEGVGNFHKVNDNVYRGAQPTDEGFRNLAKIGIKSVVDLRGYGPRSRTEEETVRAAGMRYVAVPMKAAQAPSNESIFKVLTLLEDQSAGPVFVHCLRGADRTGGVIACYRVEHDHWMHERALVEARSMGMRWFEKAIQHYILSYQPRALDSTPKLLTLGADSPALTGQQH